MKLLAFYNHFPFFRRCCCRSPLLLLLWSFRLVCFSQHVHSIAYSHTCLCLCGVEAVYWCSHTFAFKWLNASRMKCVCAVDQSGVHLTKSHRNHAPTCSTPARFKCIRKSNKIKCHVRLLCSGK